MLEDVVATLDPLGKLVLVDRMEVLLLVDATEDREVELIIAATAVEVENCFVAGGVVVKTKVEVRLELVQDWTCPCEISDEDLLEDKLCDFKEVEVDFTTVNVENFDEVELPLLLCPGCEVLVACFPKLRRDAVDVLAAETMLVDLALDDALDAELDRIDEEAFEVSAKARRPTAVVPVTMPDEACVPISDELM